MYVCLTYEQHPWTRNKDGLNPCEYAISKGFEILGKDFQAELRHLETLKHWNETKEKFT